MRRQNEKKAVSRRTATVVVRTGIGSAPAHGCGSTRPRVEPPADEASAGTREGAYAPIRDGGVTNHTRGRVCSRPLKAMSFEGHQIKATEAIANLSAKEVTSLDQAKKPQIIGKYAKKHLDIACKNHAHFMRQSSLLYAGRISQLPAVPKPLGEGRSAIRNHPTILYELYQIDI